MKKTVVSIVGAFALYAASEPIIAKVRGDMAMRRILDQAQRDVAVYPYVISVENPACQTGLVPARHCLTPGELAKLAMRPR